VIFAVGLAGDGVHDLDPPGQRRGVEPLAQPALTPAGVRRSVATASQISWPRAPATSTAAAAASLTPGSASARCSTSARATRLPPTFTTPSSRPSSRNVPSSSTATRSPHGSGRGASGARNGDSSSSRASSPTKIFTPGNGVQAEPGSSRQAMPPVSEEPKTLVTFTPNLSRSRAAVSLGSIPAEEKVRDRGGRRSRTSRPRRWLGR
jgi:hypothetical protein